MNLYVKVVERGSASARLGFFHTDTLPISQRFVWLGPIFILIAWGTSAMLIKGAK